MVGNGKMHQLSSLWTRLIYWSNTPTSPISQELWTTQKPRRNLLITAEVKALMTVQKERERMTCAGHPIPPVSRVVFVLRGMVKFLFNHLQCTQKVTRGARRIQKFRKGLFGVMKLCKCWQSHQGDNFGLTENGFIDGSHHYFQL